MLVTRELQLIDGDQVPAIKYQVSAIFRDIARVIFIKLCLFVKLCKLKNTVQKCAEIYFMVTRRSEDDVTCWTMCVPVFEEG